MRSVPPLRLAVAGLLLLSALPLAGCGDTQGLLSHPIQARGNRVDADQLAQLVPGTSTRNDALALIGSPTAKAAFDDNTWLYISELTRPVIAATNTVFDQQVVSLVFDQQGVLRRIERKRAEDSVPVTIATRTTPTPGNDTNFVQQLLGNVGRFSTGGAPGGSGPGGGSSSRSNF